MDELSLQDLEIIRDRRTVRFRLVLVVTSTALLVH